MYIAVRYLTLYVFFNKQCELYGGVCSVHLTNMSKAFSLRTLLNDINRNMTAQSRRIFATHLIYFDVACFKEF